MDKKEEGKSEKFFRDFGKKLDQFFAEAQDASARVEGDMKKAYEDLKKEAEKFRKDAGNKERWKEVEARLKKAGEELGKAAKAAFKPQQKN